MSANAFGLGHKEASMLRRRPIVPVVLLALAAAAGCSSSNPAPTVPVTGSNVSSLYGHWEGEYQSLDTGRSGSIKFELKEFGKTARGDVLMVPKDAYAPNAPNSGPAAVAAMPQVLQITFVDSTGGVVKGTMDTYVDPRCNCSVQTTFEGTVTGDTISGTFKTTPEGNFPITTGTWKMSRKKAA